MNLYNHFNIELLEELEAKASSSSRKRAHVNLHKAYDEPIQKTIIALNRGTYIPPHYHRHEHQKELFVVLSGTVRIIIFNEDGSILDILLLASGEIAEVLPFTIHTVVCISSSAIVLEIKSGPFIADDCKESLDWTIPENSPTSSEYLKWLEATEVCSQMPKQFMRI